MSFFIDMEYKEFIKKKTRIAGDSGFELNDSELNKMMKPHQRFCVKKSLRAGRFANFLDCGMGKTFIGLEFARHVVVKTGMKALILTPLGVVDQWVSEGNKFNVTLSSDIESTHNIIVTNYEQIGNIDVSKFSCVVLDESSILKNFAGKLRNRIIDTFEKTPYKLSLSATPSPNDPSEIANQAEFLNVMKREEVLAMFFVNDSMKTGNWRLKKHAVQKFYQWVSSWAIMAMKPSDIGFSDDGYILPPITYTDIEVKTPKRNNGMLFNNNAVSATDFNNELRVTVIQRVDEVVKIVNNSEQNWIVWGKHNQECEDVAKLITGAVNVQGSDKDKSKKLNGFANGEFRVLVTKQRIAAYGLNYQNCSRQVFMSPDFSFEQLYQAVRRSWRFGQKNVVEIYIVVTDTMGNVIQSIRDKERKFNEMQKQMQIAMKSTIDNKAASEPISNVQVGQMWKMVNSDCVIGSKEHLEDNSVHLSVFSPPFADLYTYSDKPEDMGNCSGYEEFVDQFKYLVKEIKRVMVPGRIVAVHCMDLPIQKGKEGYIGLRDFSGILLQLFGDEGFIYHARTTIWKNPVTEMQRTKALGLLHKTIKKDSVMSRVGIPDYIMFFRAPGDNPIPITHQDTDSTKDDFFDVDTWQKYASPVWYDIDYGNTLQYTTARDKRDEKHICPLQLDTIERIVRLYSNPDEMVVSFFAGIGSEGYKAVGHGRRFTGFELKESYYNVAVQNMNIAETKKLSWKLF